MQTVIFSDTPQMTPELEKDLEEFRTSVNARLMRLRVLKFGTMGDAAFEDKSFLGRGRVPGVRDNDQFPKATWIVVDLKRIAQRLHRRRRLVPYWHDQTDQTTRLTIHTIIT